ncbi:hypothetical protein FSP39_020101 [Pinctada imbricata]|uniref:Uncharacterized protein n=1 Tax=Pinctada imbricata TaxID=66713 RepID=A0AA88YP28_PINIB|nr:hypothetical protein FSP39_020101 [Pinctada imbricata]
MADLKVTFDRLSKCMYDWEQCTNRPTCGNRLLKIELDINPVHGGFMFNIGDSATNDGYGGDANTQRNDAEIMGLGQHTRVYYSDNCPGQKEEFLNSLNTARKVTMWVGNEFTRVQTKDATGSVQLDEQFCNKCLFALNMQPDQCPTCRNLDVYVALNNMIRGTHRRGFGVCKAKLSWECCQ